MTLRLRIKGLPSYLPEGPLNKLEQIQITIQSQRPFELHIPNKKAVIYFHKKEGNGF